MQWVKFYTRNYSLFGHSLMYYSLQKKNTSMPGIWYSAALDIFSDGLVDIFAPSKDKQRNQKWVRKTLEKNPKFLEETLENGLKETKNISLISTEIFHKEYAASNAKILTELKELKKKIFSYGGYIEFTHYLGQLDLQLDKKSVEKLSQFHDERKKALMKFLRFLDKISELIAKKNCLAESNVSNLTFNEACNFLKGKISKTQVAQMQETRKLGQFIAIWKDSKETIITKNFYAEAEKARKNIVEEKTCQEIRGMPINKGIVQGTVKSITQNTRSYTIPENAIIVTTMTNPELTPILKKAKAIITDEGGILCHAAHVAREFGIIAIIGTKIATKVLKDGDLIEVDANKGTVRKINSNKSTLL